jgi:hypothetical protein
MNPDFFERQSRFPSLPPITHLQNLMYRAFEARQLSYLKERQSETPFLSERKAVSLVVNHCFADSKSLFCSKCITSTKAFRKHDF